MVPKGTEVRLGFDVERGDRYGRTLAYVWVTSTGVFVNAELVRQGFAQPLTIPPNISHADEIADLAGGARQRWLSALPPSIRSMMPSYAAPGR